MTPFSYCGFLYDQSKLFKHAEHAKIEDPKLMAKDLNHRLLVVVVIIMLLIQGKADKLQLIRSCWNDSARERERNRVMRR